MYSVDRCTFSCAPRFYEVIVTPQNFIDVSTLPLRSVVHRTALWFVPRLMTTSFLYDMPKLMVNICDIPIGYA